MITAESFWERVDKTSGDDCWLWRGKRNGRGYGQVYVGGGRQNARLIVAHRIAWTLTFGEIPENLLVCHRCDNPSCVRPEHLFIGTMSDNIRDASAKKRLGSQKYPERYRESLVKATRASLKRRETNNWKSPGRSGRPHTEETKLKISQARRRIKL